MSVTTLGCKVNQVEAEQAVATMLSRGAELVEPESADAIVVHTCCVTAEAEKKVRKAVRRALRAGSARVYVTGCLASIDPDGLALLDDRVTVVRDVAAAADVVVASTVTAEPGSRVGEAFHTRAMVKVQDGCDTRCAYCIVPSARGASRSTPLGDVSREVGALVNAGVVEVVLTGVNLGAYASDGADISDLIAAVAESGVERLRLSSIEPEHIARHLIEVLAETPALCPHLHVPLQSGSERILTAMGRGYTPTEYTTAIREARRARNGLTITTDVMVGFPGETDEDHASTVALLSDLTGIVSKLHVFRFSPRPGTRAATMPDPVPADVSRARATELRELGDSLRRGYQETRIGAVAQVLIEEVQAGSARGTSRDYLKVRVADGKVDRGALVDLELIGVDGAWMTSRPTPA